MRMKCQNCGKVFNSTCQHCKTGYITKCPKCGKDYIKRYGVKPMRLTWYSYRDRESGKLRKYLTLAPSSLDINVFQELGSLYSLCVANIGLTSDNPATKSFLEKKRRLLEELFSLISSLIGERPQPKLGKGALEVGRRYYTCFQHGDLTIGKDDDF